MIKTNARKVLNIINKSEGINVYALAKELDLSYVTTRKWVGYLVENKYIETISKKVKNRKTWALEITDKGKKLLEVTE